MGVFDSQLQVWSQKRLTGYLEVQVHHLQQWKIHIDQGRCLWVQGGLHPQRRWHRWMNVYAPELVVPHQQVSEAAVAAGTELQLLMQWVRAQELSPEQARAWVRSAAAEVFFDILQAEELYGLNLRTAYGNSQLVLDWVVNLEQLFHQVQHNWREWCQAGMVKVSPNYGLRIEDSTVLQQQLAPQIYQSLARAMTGERTIQDIALSLKQPPLLILRTLLPYLRKGSIRVLQIPDFSVGDLPTDEDSDGITLLEPPKSGSPSAKPTPDRPTPEHHDASVTKLQPFSMPPPQRLRTKKSLSLLATAATSSTPDSAAIPPLVLYVDDSRWECHRMELLLKSRGYRYVTIHDSIQALPSILEHRPDLIFLDLVMPVANGYELCAQIRRVERFKQIPVVILTSNDGMVDRVRAKIVRATEYLNKPIQPDQLDATLQKYCPLPS